MYGGDEEMSVLVDDSGLSVEVDRTGGALVISAHGDVDAMTADQLQSVLDRMSEAFEDADQAAPVIDLSGVGFLGSAGLSVLHAAATTVTPRRLRVVASGAAKRVIQVTGLDRIVSVYDDLPSAGVAAG